MSQRRSLSLRSALSYLNGSRSRTEGLSEVLRDSRLSWIDRIGLIFARPIIKDSKLFSFLLRLSHNRLLIRSFKVIILAAVINLALSLISFAPSADTVSCPDHYAILMPASEPFPGRYLRCEDFDSFYELWDSGRLVEAKALTFTP